MIDKCELDRAFDERFPIEIKDKLNSASVAIAGLGGLGSNIAVMLARTGVGHMHLVDFDVVDTTNLNRQMYGISHIGIEKTKALKDILDNINPYLDITYECKRITEDNIVDTFSDYEIVCEAFDRAEAKAMLINGLLLKCPKTIIVSGNGMAGFADANLIITEQKLKRLYVCGDETADIEKGLGLMAPRVAICAGHMANKVVQLIVNGR